MENQPQSPRLLDQVRNRIRYLHYSLQTERAYIHWIKRYIYFHNKRHPKDMAESEVVAFLNYLANKKRVSASTQNQAMNAIVFLYKQVLQKELGIFDQLQHAQRHKRLPVVLTPGEINAVISVLQEPYRTMAGLMYGSGLRMTECLKLRIMDVDFARRELFVRGGKGCKDRVSVLPESATPGLHNAIAIARNYFEQDQKAGIDFIELPFALDRKYPNAGKEFKWQFIFASGNISVDPRTKRKGRYHIHPTSLRRAISKAVKEAGIMKHVSCHVFRHSFATHLLENGYGRFLLLQNLHTLHPVDNIRTIQDKSDGIRFGRTKYARRVKTMDGFHQLLGHRHVNTTMIYTHVLNRGGKGVKSPLDTVLS